MLKCQRRGKSGADRQPRLFRSKVFALDARNGELIWSYGEPATPRYEYSMRADYGKGVAYAEIDGRGVVYISSPAFFLTALDAESGGRHQQEVTIVPELKGRVFSACL